MADPARYNMTIYRGLTFTKTFILKDSAGDALDLTGYVFNLTAKTNMSDETNVIELTNGSGITVTTGTGTVVLSIDETVTPTYTDDRLFYTFSYTLDNNDLPLMIGILSVEDVAL